MEKKKLGIILLIPAFVGFALSIFTLFHFIIYDNIFVVGLCLGLSCLCLVIIAILALIFDKDLKKIIFR